MQSLKFLTAKSFANCYIVVASKDCAYTSFLVIAQAQKPGATHNKGGLQFGKVPVAFEIVQQPAMNRKDTVRFIF
jgi:hypothetical protein